MPEKIYLTSDQYVVKELEEKKQEIIKLNQRYDDLLARVVTQQAKLQKLEDFKKRFVCRRLNTQQGYVIECLAKCGNAMIYNWSNKISEEFQFFLDFLGLSLPVGEEDEKVNG